MDPTTGLPQELEPLTPSTADESQPEMDTTRSTDETPCECESTNKVEIGGTLGNLMELLTAVAVNEDGCMLQATKAGLDAIGFNYEVQPLKTSDGPQLVTFGMKIKSGITKVIISIRENAKTWCLYMQAPSMIPEEHRSRASLFLCRANYGLVIGDMEMDLEDGEIRFKISNHLTESKLSPAMVEQAVGLATHSMDKFFPGLMAVVYGGRDPKGAYDDCVRDPVEDEEERTRQAQ